MRSFNANFITEKNKRADGPAPINLLTFGFSTPKYISDRDITPSGGSAHAGLIKEWGFIDSSIAQTPGSGVLGAIQICDLQLTIINSESPPFSDNFTITDPPENVTVELYQWFNGLLYSEKEIIFKGIIAGQPKYDEQECRLTIRGIFEKYNKLIGEDLIINVDDYADADPDDIGRMQNICYGDSKKIPCRSIKSGGVDNLESEINASVTSAELSNASEFSASGVIQCDDEKISYTGKTGNTFTGCTRGYDGTDAKSHAEGEPVWQIIDFFVYEVAGHPVKSIGDIYVDDMRVTALATKYTGQTGNQLGGYGDKAVFTVPARITRQQAIDLLVDDGIDVNDAIALVDTIDVADGISIAETIGVSDTILVNDNIGVSDTIDVSDNIDVTDTIDVDDGIGVSDTIAVNDSIGVSDDIVIKTILNSIHHSSDSDIGDHHHNVSATDVISSGHNNFSPVIVSANSKNGSSEKWSFTVDVISLGTSGTFRVSIKPFHGSTYTTVFEINNGVISVPLYEPFLKFWPTYDTPTSNGEFKTYVGGGFDGDAHSRLTDVEVTLNEYETTATKTGSANKSGSASKTGAATKSGAVTKIGTVVKTGAASKSGAASKTGSASKSGAATKTGTVTKNGTVNKTGAATKDGTVTKTGTVTLTGNSVADMHIGKLVVANNEGYQDDASGTYTGTPNALIERPDHIFKHLWIVILSAPAGDIDTPTFNAAGTFFAANSYKFSLLISKPIRAEDLFMKLALQCRSRFFVSPYGKAKLIVRQLDQASGHSIPKSEIKRGSMSIQRSSTDDLINFFNIWYDLDHSKESGSTKDCRAVKPFSDATSITRYGQREWTGAKNLFLFDAVTDAAMIAHVGAFLLDYHKLVRNGPDFAVFLDNMETEPGDIIDITHSLDSMNSFACEVLKIMHTLGSAKSNVIDHVQVIAADNSS